MPNLSIKNVSAEIVGILRDRAAANHRSLQGELLALISNSVNDANDEIPGQLVRVGSQRTRQGHKSIEQIAAEHLQRHAKPIRKGDCATQLIRADRDAR